MFVIKPMAISQIPKETLKNKSQHGHIDGNPITQSLCHYNK